ncbi:MAG: hypothetical protein HYY78_12435 [Betaproteobacteria bacterium]|nr:hypothetical protein [Betaproteobacteria bacterium]
MNEGTVSGRAVGAGQGWTWIADGFGLFRKNPGMWIALILVLGVILIVLSVIPVIGAVATLLLLPVFSGGLMLGCQALQRDGALEMGHLFAGFKTQTRSLIVLGALSLAAWVIVVLPALLIVGGGAFFGAMRGDVAGIGTIGASFVLAMLVVLGLSVPVYMALWFAPALVVLRGLAPLEAIKRSFAGCLKNIVPFLVYGIVMLVLGILATIPLALGWLVLGPVLVGSVYVAYRDIYGDA